MAFGEKCLKIFVIVLNILFWLLGLGILAAGLWVKVDIRAANIAAAANIGFTEPVIDIAVWIFIGTGILVFVVGFLGCCGAIKESKILLGFYIFFVVLVFIAEVAAGAYVVYRWNEIESGLKETGRQWIKDKYDNSNDASKGLNYVQARLCCCGMTGFKDYQNATYQLKELSSGVYFTYSCCKPTNEESSQVQISVEDKQTCLTEAEEVYKGNPPQYDKECDKAFRTEGCYTRLVDEAKSNMIILFVVGFSIAFFQLVIFVLAVCLCRRIDQSEKLYK